MTDYAIARCAGVDQEMVREWRKQINPTQKVFESKRTGSDGRTINIANIGRKAQLPPAAPVAAISQPSVIATPQVSLPVSVKVIHEEPDPQTSILLISTHACKLRPLSTFEEADLRQSLQDAGQLEAIVRDRKTGVMVDGEQRYRLLTELGMIPVYRDRDFKDEAEMLRYRYVVNTVRRQITPEQLAEFRDYQRYNFAELRGGGATLTEAARAVGVSQATAERWEATAPASKSRKRSRPNERMAKR